MNLKTLFLQLYNAGTEDEVESVLVQNSSIFFAQKNWHPLGGNENSFGVIENQQSSPIAALIEKITNSIDATLMKRCLELKIDPKSSDAPRTIPQALDVFYPNHNSDWSLKTFRRKQSEEIQIIADGPTRNTSVIIYDNGEGQHPNKFEDTFLSLLRGNKNEIHFVQGKYNMGGSGAIVFCGKRRYQLIASKRFDNSGEFGFTLIRQHPLTKEEEGIKKNTWYEYLKLDGEIPSFRIDRLDLGLHNRKFETGTIIKLFSYQFPSGYSGFAQDLNQSINEFLYEPALPILTVDKKERYPKNKVLELDLYGLKRRLENIDGSDNYIEEKFSSEYEDELFDKMKVTCYIFKAKVKDWNISDTKKNIRKRFFKNNMSVLFSMNGQVHGHYTSEFITRSLKKNLLKDHLLIHVDCTHMNYNFRKELFMASRDRLKNGEETRALRKFLASKLGAKASRLTEIEKNRKSSISVSGESTKELLKNFTNNLPINSDLRKLLGNAFKLEDKKKTKSSINKKNLSNKNEKKPFNPKRYPTYLKLNGKNAGDTTVAKIPLGGEKVMKFDTDVEDDYFDRVDDPGDMEIALLNFAPNDKEGGNSNGTPKKIEDVLNVEKTSPKEGKLKIVFAPKKDVKVGDAIQVKVSLNDKGTKHDQIFWVKISEKNQPKDNVPKKDKDEEPLGLPTPILMYQKEEKEGAMTWEKVMGATSTTIDYYTVMYPLASGDNLESIYINMDSNVLKNFKSKHKNPSKHQLELADRKYLSSVYFHTLFLYTITKKRKYQFTKIVDGVEDSVDLGAYLQDLFDSFYSEFILSFGSVDLMESLGE